MAGGFRYSVEIDGAGQAMLARSNALAPRRTGAMIASGGVEVSGGVARVSYGAVYARIQHDGAGFRHPGGGQAGFLAAALADGAAARALIDGFRL